jgi:hypothetical protein
MTIAAVDQAKVVEHLQAAWAQPLTAGKPGRPVDDAYRNATPGQVARVTWQKLVAGKTADDVYPEAVADADRAFALLATGLG